MALDPPSSTQKLYLFKKNQMSDLENYTTENKTQLENYHAQTLHIKGHQWKQLLILSNILTK